MLTIKEIVQLLAHNGDESYGHVCTVKRVDGLVCDVEPINGDAPILDVRLVADESENKFVLVPKVGSIVVVQFITKEAAYLSMVSEVSQVLWKIGDSYLSCTDQGFVVKKGDDDLKDVLSLIIEAVETIIVMQGRNPDRVKLATAKEKVNNIFS